MNTLDDIAQAVAAIFPKQETSSGLEAETHRVETKPTEGDPNSLDVVIVQVFPPPAKRFELRIEKTANGWLSHPKVATDSYMAQAVAMRLQRNATGSDDVRSVRNSAGLFAVSFVTGPQAPKVELIEAKPKRVREQEASV